MIVNPDNYLESFAELGADILTVHYEACTHLHRTVQRVKDLKMKAGVAINPHTPISSLKSIIKELDLVCIMSVNPGFGGQSFIEGTYSKIEELKSLIKEQSSKAIIEIDGGVNSENAKKLIDCGANALVAGSFVFKSKNPTETISKLSSLIN
jgi:ribulose-phosphate 3-epimerase